MTATLLVSALLMGLLGSTHCVAMCGGVASALSVGLVPLGRKPAPRTLVSLAYNAGRIASYALAGAVAGAFGAIADRVDFLQDTRIGLRVVAGLLMIAVGVHLTGAFRQLGRLEALGAPLWRVIEPLARRFLPARTVGAALGLGLVWGWMPCGLVYSALGVALGTGSVAAGALAMTGFGLGTLPSMMAVGALASHVTGMARRGWIRALAGVVIVGFGLLNVATASAQVGFTPAPAGAHCCAHGRR